VSPHTEFPPEKSLDSPIVERIINDPAVIHEVRADSVVLAARSELIVHRPPQAVVGPFDSALAAVARPCGTLASLAAGAPVVGGANVAPGGPAASISDVEIWRLTDPQANAIDEARRLRGLAPDTTLQTGAGAELCLPRISPNHLSIVSPHFAGCPAGPPQPTAPGADGAGFVAPLLAGRQVRVVVIDTGYIEVSPPNAALDARVTSLAGLRLDTNAEPPRWVPDPPDEITTDANGRLHEIVGHGTFIAGLIAHLCPAAVITSVGQRDEDVILTGETAPEQQRLYSSEIALAHALLSHGNADVVQLGFSFPTLDDYPSIPFTRAMQELTGPQAPRPGIAVVCPAGNESSADPYWPAALPDVIGVAATNRRGRSRAPFSNWGPWLQCCARGVDVVSNYIYWTGPVEGDPIDEIETFAGWARWDGTSFAAPKVSAAIAGLVAAEAGLLPTAAFTRLLAGQTAIAVTNVTDQLPGQPAVTLPQLHIG
jgi:hypothetical protein